MVSGFSWLLLLPLFGTQQLMLGRSSANKKFIVRGNMSEPGGGRRGMGNHGVGIVSSWFYRLVSEPFTTKTASKHDGLPRSRESAQHGAEGSRKYRVGRVCVAVPGTPNLILAGSGTFSFRQQAPSRPRERNGQGWQRQPAAVCRMLLARARLPLGQKALTNSPQRGGLISNLF